MKSVAWSFVFKLALIAITLISTVLILYEVVGNKFVEIISKFGCAAKVNEYCYALCRNENPSQSILEGCDVKIDENWCRENVCKKD
ncbi:MAG: hypothetical protein RQ930_01345 [Candidatus Aenigmarchaeota archaeon]|jgi:hypothetical protein|nr:hypothetical protein [Candidatus Aenigmarchaeota archaeon]